MQSNEYLRLRRELEKIKSDNIRNQALLDKHMQQLEEDFGVNTIVKAKNKLSGMKKAQDTLEKKIEFILRDIKKQLEESS